MVKKNFITQNSYPLLVMFNFLFKKLFLSLGTKTIPVAQMLSQEHTQSFIRFWLSKWAQYSKQPHEIIIDESQALIGACIQVFTNSVGKFEINN
jgi:hypothetical protein